jgi:DNA modification methylase
VEISTEPALTKPGDVWLLGSHRLICGDALDESAYSALMNGAIADLVFSDPPYNVKIDALSQSDRIQNVWHACLQGLSVALVLRRCTFEERDGR